MNIINKAFLQLALLPASIYERMGIETTHLKAILTTKLIIDDRRPNTFHQTKLRKKEKPINAATIGTILISALLGFIYLMAFAVGQDIVTKLTFYFSFFFFMLAASLISDFTAVLIDVRDNYIILPKPVNDRTILTARILHIFIHISKLVIPMSLPGLVTITTMYGWWGAILFVFMVLMVTLFTIFFINALYILILRITTPEKFQAIISYVQVGFAIVLYASNQLLPRMMENFQNISFSTGNNPLFLLVPSYWFASGWNLFYSLNGRTLELIAAVISIVLPVLSLFIVVKYLAPSFNNKLAMISSSTSESNELAEVKTVSQRKYSDWLSKWFTKSGPERMGFLFSWKMSNRSRDFRLKVYPSIGYLLVYIVFILLQSKELSVDDIRSETTKGKAMLLMGLYICSYLPIMAINQSSFSEKFRAAWIYFTTPVRKPGLIISGSTKALILKFALPLAAVTVAASLLIIGVSALPNIVLGLINQVLLSCIVVFVGYQQLPFSMYEGNKRKTGNFVRGLTSVLASGMVGLLHFFIYNSLPVVIIFIFLSSLATWLLMDSIKNISWEKIKRESRDL